jgi:hypothetical protein
MSSKRHRNKPFVPRVQTQQESSDLSVADAPIKTVKLSRVHLTIIASLLGLFLLGFLWLLFFSSSTLPDAKNLPKQQNLTEPEPLNLDQLK